MALLNQHGCMAAVKVCDHCGGEFRRRARATDAQWREARVCSRNCALGKGRALRVRPSLTDRFWSKVDRAPGHGPNGDCWVWRASSTSFGYGTFKYPGRGALAHRASYVMNVGEIPDGLNVLHRCDNPRCVRPEHLFIGNHHENMADMVAKGRGVVPRGEKSPHAKLTEADALAIRADARPQRVIAEAYGVSKSAIMQIKTGRNWKHLWQALLPATE